MEELPKTEKENSEQRLAKLIREKGGDDPAVKELLSSWLIEQQRLADESRDSDSRILLNLRRARLYFEAGLQAEALENFESAKTLAWNLYKDELYEAIKDEIEKLWG